MNDSTQGMLNSLYAANAQTKAGFAGIETALKVLEGTDEEKKAYNAMSKEYAEIVRLLDSIQKKLKPFI